MDSLPEVVIVSFQEGDFLGKCIILLLHPVVFYQSHLTENKRRQKISCKEDARSDEQPLPPGSPNSSIGLDIVPFAHEFQIYGFSRAIIRKIVSLVYRKKTTKASFVVESHCRGCGYRSITSLHIGYFFLVVFFAFFAGAFFLVAIAITTPFRVNSFNGTLMIYEADTIYHGSSI